MHWGSSFFVLIFLIGLGVSLVPIRLQFGIQHRQSWHGTVTIQALWLHYSKQFGAQPTAAQQSAATVVQRAAEQTAQHFAQQEKQSDGLDAGLSADGVVTSVKQQEESWHFQAHWWKIGKFLWRAAQIALRRISLEQLSLRCKIGFARPDNTAYSYALFWALLSVVPQAVLKCADITYVPDFQQQRQDIQLQGIIRASVGQAMLMIISWLWLVVQAKLEQDGKEQIAYEG